MARQLGRCSLLQGSLQTVPCECIADPLTLAGKSVVRSGGDVAVLESKGGGGGLAPFAGVMVAGVRHCLEELLLSKVCSSWLLPWPLTQNTAAVMKELPQEGLCSPSLFFKSGGYHAPKILREASLNLSRAVALFRSFVSGFLYEYNNNDLPLFKILPFTDYFGPLQGKLVSSSAPGRG